MELKVWVEGIQRIVCGVTDKTTCQVRNYFISDLFIDREFTNAVLNVEKSTRYMLKQTFKCFNEKLKVS